ncbi:hypothetical protein ABW21_db0202883 [Orbilia brochopaga]|nr:hypothetical protein ABW21_db0202883 [Drechslerella brochopaga]
MKVSAVLASVAFLAVASAAPSPTKTTQFDTYEACIDRNAQFSSAAAPFGTVTEIVIKWQDLLQDVALQRRISTISGVILLELSARQSQDSVTHWLATGTLLSSCAMMRNPYAIFIDCHDIAEGTAQLYNHCGKKDFKGQRFADGNWNVVVRHGNC